MKNIVLLLIVTILTLSFIFSKVEEDEDFYNYFQTGRKIYLDDETIDTKIKKPFFEMKKLKFKPHKNLRLRQFYVHLQPPYTKKDLKKLYDELKSFSNPQYIPHNTFSLITDYKHAERVYKEHLKKGKKILWIGEVESKHKIGQELRNIFSNEKHQDLNSDSLFLEVLLFPTKRRNSKQLAKHWMKNLIKKDILRSRRFKISPVSTEKILVSIENKKKMKPKSLKKIVDYLSKNYQTSHIQLKERFTPLYGEDVLSSIDTPTKNDFYKNILYNATQFYHLVSNSSGIGQSAMPDVQFLWNKGLNGSGEFIGIGDTGIDYNNCFFHDKNHPVPFNYFSKNTHRKIAAYYTHADNKDSKNGHGTHIAGIAAGESKETPFFNGIIPKSKIVFMDIGTSGGYLELPFDLTTDYFPKFYPHASISSNSWGNNRFGVYTMSAREIDYFSHKNKHFLSLFASGNSGRSGLHTLTAPSTAKNCLTVGSSQGSYNSFKLGYPLYSELLRNQMKNKFCKNPTPFLKNTCKKITSLKNCCKSSILKKFCCLPYIYEQMRKYPERYSEKNMATFSSRGPTKDGRIKPDLITPGQPIFSARSDGTSSKKHCPIPLVMQGTSQSTPLMAGYAVMVKQYYQKGFYPTGVQNDEDGFNPTGALIKATLINSGENLPGSVDLNGSGKWGKLSPMPSVVQGFGKVKPKNTLLFKESNFDLFIKEGSLNVGEKHEMCFEVLKENKSNPKEFKATLVWMDYPAQPLAKITLVNDLDLVVKNKKTGKIYYPNGANKPDRLNNVEQVSIQPNVDSNQFIKVTVEGKNIPHGPQDYALTVSGHFVKKPVSFCSNSPQKVKKETIEKKRSKTIFLNEKIQL